MTMKPKKGKKVEAKASAKAVAHSSNVDIHQKELEVMQHHAKAEISSKELEIQKLRQELTIKDKMLREQNSDLVVRRLKGQLIEQTKSLEILELMKSEYAVMAMGESAYYSQQGYHDGRMFEFAEKQWENLEEAKRCDAALAEIRQGKLQEEMQRAEEEENLAALNSLVMRVAASDSARSTSLGVRRSLPEKERSKTPQRSQRRGSE